MKFNSLDIGLLELSHIPHILAAGDALKKGYIAYFYLLISTILLSALNHFPFGKILGKNSIGILNKLNISEKISTYIVLGVTIGLFYNQINYVDILFAVLAAIIYFAAFFDYFQNDLLYVPLHTVWHIVGGVLLYSIILKAPHRNKPENGP